MSTQQTSSTSYNPKLQPPRRRGSDGHHDLPEHTEHTEIAVEDNDKPAMIPIEEEATFTATRALSCSPPKFVNSDLKETAPPQTMTRLQRAPKNRESIAVVKKQHKRTHNEPEEQEQECGVPSRSPPPQAPHDSSEEDTAADDDDDEHEDRQMGIRRRSSAYNTKRRLKSTLVQMEIEKAPDTGIHFSDMIRKSLWSTHRTPESDETPMNNSTHSNNNNATPDALAEAFMPPDHTASRKNPLEGKNLFQRLMYPLHCFLYLVPVQIFMFLALIVDFIFLVIEFATDNSQYNAVNMTTSSLFMTEVVVHLGFLGWAYFRHKRFWMILEFVVVTTSFIVECVVIHLDDDSELRNRLRYIRIIRVLRVLIMWKTRTRHFVNSLRQMVSADRRRYQHDGFDLDLTYVYKHVLAMSWPSEKMESIYRNHIGSVAAFLDHTHPESYWVYNLCSERQYDETRFHNRVTRYRLDDHNPAELWIMYAFAKDAQEFLQKDFSRNVIVIHCKGGKGRTGTMTCAYMLFSGLQRDAEAAMTHFGKQRTSESAKVFQGVESPSQGRYVTYFARALQEIPRGILETKGFPTRLVRITKLTLHSIPLYALVKGIDRLWFVIVTRPSTDRTVMYISNPTITFNPNVRVKGANKSTSLSTAADIGNELTCGTPINDSLTGSSGKRVFGKGSGSPLQANDDCRAYGGNMIIYVNGSTTPMDVETFHRTCLTVVSSSLRERSTTFMNNLKEDIVYSANTSPIAAGYDSSACQGEVPDSATGSFSNNVNGPFKPLPQYNNAKVDVSFNTSGIPPLSEDTVIKFYYNVDNPDALHPVFQFWFHPYFEKSVVSLSKCEVDGPHKEGTKEKKYLNSFGVEMALEDCPEEEK